MNNCTICGKPTRFNECSCTCRSIAIERRNAEKPKKKVSHGTCSECKGPIMRWPDGGTKPKTCSQECAKERNNRRGRERNQLFRKLLGRTGRKCEWCGVGIDHLSLNSKYCCDLHAHEAAMKRQQARYKERVKRKKIANSQEITDKIQLYLCGRALK